MKTILKLIKGEAEVLVLLTLLLCFDLENGEGKISRHSFNNWLINSSSSHYIIYFDLYIQIF